MQIDFDSPVDPDEHEINAACEKESSILVQLKVHIPNGVN